MNQINDTTVIVPNKASFFANPYAASLCCAINDFGKSRLFIGSINLK
jgi:hypothetical protein